MAYKLVRKEDKNLYLVDDTSGEDKIVAMNPKLVGVDGGTISVVVQYNSVNVDTGCFPITIA